MYIRRAWILGENVDNEHLLARRTKNSPVSSLNLNTRKFQKPTRQSLTRHRPRAVTGFMSTTCKVSGSNLI